MASYSQKFLDLFYNKHLSMEDKKDLIRALVKEGFDINDYLLDAKFCKHEPCCEIIEVCEVQKRQKCTSNMSRPSANCLETIEGSSECGLHESSGARDIEMQCSCGMLNCAQDSVPKSIYSDMLCGKVFCSCEHIMKETEVDGSNIVDSSSRYTIKLCDNSFSHDENTNLDIQKLCPLTFPLFMAVGSDNYELTELLLQLGACPLQANLVLDSTSTCICHDTQSISNHIKSAHTRSKRVLCACIGTTDSICPTIIHEACQNGNLDIVQLIVNYIHSWTKKYKQYSTWTIHDGLPMEDSDCFVHNPQESFSESSGQKQLHRKCDCEKLRDVTNNQGRTAFMLAVESGNVTLVEWLIKTGLDVNITDCLGDNALHIALQSLEMKQTVNVVKVLCNNDVDILHKNKHGDTPVEEAVMQLQLDSFQVMVNELMNNKLYQNVSETESRLCDVGLSKFKQEQKVVHLEAIDELDDTIKYFLTSLYISNEALIVLACKTNNTNLLRTLLELGTSVYTMHRGMSLFKMAVVKKNLQVFDLLMQHLDVVYGLDNYSGITEDQFEPNFGTGLIKQALLSADVDFLQVFIMCNMKESKVLNCLTKCVNSSHNDPSQNSFVLKSTRFIPVLWTLLPYLQMAGFSEVMTLVLSQVNQTDVSLGQEPDQNVNRSCSTMYTETGRRNTLLQKYKCFSLLQHCRIHIRRLLGERLYAVLYDDILNLPAYLKEYLALKRL